jgi:exosortase
VDSIDIENPAAIAESEAPEHAWSEVPPHVWVQVCTIAVLYVYLHWNLIMTMYDIAKRDHDWSHAVLIPFISLYFLHHNRQKILSIVPETCWWGFPVFLAGLVGHLLAIFPVRSIMSQGYTMIIELFGLVLLLLGPRLARVLWFPIFYLVFAIKFSNRYWNLVAWTLQLFAARSSVALLNILGVEAEVRGSTIEIWRGVDFVGALNVAEACSGLRMLMAFLALGAALIYIVERPWWARLALALLAVPIAVAVNVLRVTITGMLHLISPDLSSGDFHVLIGMFMVFPAMLLFLLVGWILDHILVVEHVPHDEDNDEAEEEHDRD